LKNDDAPSSSGIERANQIWSSTIEKSINADASPTGMFWSRAR
jgi:hypothetical protein